MKGNGKVKCFATINKDEAAFHLSELARGLLRNRISIPVGERNLVMPTFDSIRLEMKAYDKEERYAIEIRLSWRKRPPSIASVSPDDDPMLRNREAEGDRPAVHAPMASTVFPSTDSLSGGGAGVPFRERRR